MLNQENIYRHIFNEEWTNILKLLYSFRNEISNDELLKQAATIFEQEFFKKVQNYSTARSDIEDNLDILYILNHGGFYKLSNENYKILIVELVKRKPLKEAFGYAMSFPEEQICKAKIEEYKSQELEEENIHNETTHESHEKWIEIYNRLFELINVKGDTATYYSGPKFIDTIREFNPYFSNYSQFIDKRNREGKSTSRKIFFYDILMNLNYELRLKVVNRILNIVKPFELAKVETIENLLGIQSPQNKKFSSSETRSTNPDNPVVFISYSWDDETHKDWVLSLANRLCSDGVDVLLDRFELSPGKNLPYFVESSIEKAQRVIIVFTEEYKRKADERLGGVGYEYSIMNADLYSRQTDNEKIIPILRKGSKDSSIPTFMQQFIHIDVRNDKKFENSYLDLLREIYNEPGIQKPNIGLKPIFGSSRSEKFEPNQIQQKPEINENYSSYKFDNFHISEDRVGIFSNGMTISNVYDVLPKTQIKKIVGYGEFADDTYDDYEIYDSTGDKILVLTPLDNGNTNSKINRILILDARFQTSEKIGLKSTFRDLSEFYSMRNISPDLEHIVVEIDHINARFGINKNQLDKDWWTGNEIDVSKIPGKAIIDNLTVWWK